MLLALVLVVVIVQLFRFVRNGAYRHYFAAFVGLYHVNLLLASPGAASTSQAPWFALMAELSTWIGASYIFTWFVFPRDLFPHAARAKPQGPSKPLRS